MNYQRLFRSIQTVLLAAFMGMGLVATGCGGIPLSLNRDVVTKIHRTDVFAHLPQEHIVSQYMPSTHGSTSLIAGLLIDVPVNVSRSQKAEQRARPLREQVKDVDFRASLWKAVIPVVRETPWLKMGDFETLAVGQESITAAMVDDASALYIGVSYALTPDARVLRVDTKLDFYLPGQHRKPAAESLLTYYSAKVGEPVEDGAIRLWTADGAEAFRLAVDDAVEESARLVRHALTAMGDSSSGTPRAAAVFADLTHARGDFGRAIPHAELTGTVLEETEGRIIFREEFGGRLFSFPRRDIQFRFLSPM